MSVGMGPTSLARWNQRLDKLPTLPIHIGTNRSGRIGTCVSSYVWQNGVEAADGHAPPVGAFGGRSDQFCQKVETRKYAPM